MIAPAMASVGLPARRYNVELVKKNRSHWYDVRALTGEQLAFLPGVTGVLGVIAKPMLIPWATKMALQAAEAALMDRLKGKPEARIKLTPQWVAEVVKEAKERPDKIKDEAADLGTMAHQVFDDVVLGKEVLIENVPEAIKQPVQNFLDWLKSSGVQLVMGDTAVASIAAGFGGKIDALGWKDGQYGIIDFKTSSGIWPEYALQVAAYAHGFEETFGVPIGFAEIVRFDKNKPIFEHKRISNLTVSYGAFAAAKELQSILKDHVHFDD